MQFLGMEIFDVYQQITSEYTHLFRIGHAQTWGHTVTNALSTADNAGYVKIILRQQTANGQIVELWLGTYEKVKNENQHTSFCLDSCDSTDQNGILRLRHRVTKLVEALHGVSLNPALK